MGPGNCLIDSWIRKNSDEKFDYNGKLADSGNVNEIIFEQAQELYLNRKNKKNFLMTSMILIFLLPEDCQLRMALQL